MKRKYTTLLFLCGCLSLLSAKSYTLNSPDGKTTITVNTTPQLTYTIEQDGEKLLNPSPLALYLTDGTIWGMNPEIKSHKKKLVKETITAPFYKTTKVENHYRSLVLKCKGNWGVEFRAYNDGVAYRFSSFKAKEYCIKKELVSYQFIEDAVATVPYVRSEGTLETQLADSFENTYITAPLSQLNTNRLIMVPTVVNAPNGKRLCITESDLRNYPGLYLKSQLGEKSLKGYFAPYPKKEEVGGHNQLQKLVKERENYIAQVKNKRTFPWRTVIIARNDIDLANTTMTYRLASPSKIEDTTWIKPGKVAWDWWNNWNIEGVDFKAGVNNATYKYYIDFAAKYGIEYVILDEGWSVNLKHDLFQVVPEIDLKELVAYGKKQQVGIVLWAGYYAFDRDMENVCKHYAKLGIKGFKIDFMNRNDQKMVAFHERAAKMCAKYHLFADFHGTYIPAGLNRTYPNALNFEAVHGLEQCKWIPDSIDQVTYDVTLPYTRMVAGPIDYTQGAMRNANQECYASIWSEPMSQGTRCHQLAEYIVFLSPFNMLCDAPSNYEHYPSNVKYMAQVPTTWDETQNIQGKMGEYIVTARRKGNKWYIGGLNNWTARDITLDLKELIGAKEKITLELFKDGINADKKATDFVHHKEQEANTLQKIHMAPGGGFALIVTL